MKILEKYFPLEAREHQRLASACADRHPLFRKDEDAEIGEDAVTSDLVVPPRIPSHV